MDKNKNRGWQRVLLLIFPYIIIVGIFQLIGYYLMGIDILHSDIKETSIQKLIISFFDFIGTFSLLWFFMKYVDKQKFVTLGFQFKNRFKEFTVGFGIGILILGLGYVLLQSIGEITFQKINLDFKEILISVLLFIIVAVVEETLLRGYVLRNLMQSFNKYVALIISSLLFSVMHGFNPNIDLFALTNLFLAGILLGLSYIYTKNLWFPIALHLSWNLFQALLGFNVSGQESYSIIEFSISDKNLLNGGDFGFEGSIFSIILMSITIIGIWIYYNQVKMSHNNEEI